MDRLKLAWVTCLAMLLTVGIASAQVNTGTILGTVTDTSGQVLPGVKVTVENQDTGISRNLTTDEGGRYSAPSVSLGHYKVTGTLAGFQTIVRTGIELTVGQDAVVDLTLTVGAVTTEVQVNGEVPLVETTSASLGSLVDDQTIRALPLNGRSYDQLALLQPGVALTDPGSINGNSPFFFGSGKRFSVGGQRDVSNSFLLDGTDINDQGNGTPGGAAGTNLGVDTIQEFKIFTSSYKAEYGHSMGSVTSSITRSGTNSFHGTAFEYMRNSVLDAMNFFDVGTRTPPFRRNQFGGVFGGPIKRDKTFFFVGYEGLRQAQETTQFATVPTDLAREGILPTATVTVNPAILPFLALYPHVNNRDFGDGTGLFEYAPSTVTNEDNVMARVDEQLTSKTGIFARYIFDRDYLYAPQAIPTNVQVSGSQRQYFTVQANTVLSAKTLNNIRFAFNRTDSDANQFFSPNPPGTDFIPGQPLGLIQIGSIGGNSARALTSLGSIKGEGLLTWAFNVFEYGDDLTYTTGKHSFKVGGDIQRIQDNTLNSNGIRGTYTFSTLTTFLEGKPSSLTAASPLGVPPYLGIRQYLFGFYGQDDYAVNSHLTLNLGMRWETATDPYSTGGEMSYLPSISSTSMVVSGHYFSIGKKNFEPRFGLAWRLDADGKTVLRAGAGIYHNQILPWAYWNALYNPPFYGTFSASNPPFPNGYTVLGPQTSIQLKPMAPFLKTPVNDQYTVSIQRQISPSTVIMVDYAGNHSNHLMTLIEADTPLPTFINGQPYYAPGSKRRNPAWNGMQYNSTDANSDYNSGTVTLRRDLSKGLEGQVFYTFSKSMDEASSSSSADQTRAATAVLNPFNIAQDWGLSTFNVKHAVVGNLSYHLPFRTGSKAFGGIVNGWSLDGIVTVESGLPFTPRLTTAVSNDLSTQFAERPDLIPGFSTNPIHGVSAGCPGFAAGTPVGGPSNWYDPCAFSVPANGTYGTLGRDTVIGPPLRDVDTAMEKTFQVREGINVTFRGEVFNIFNHPNFGLPNTTAIGSNGEASPSAGVITYTTTSSRQIQLALRLNF